MTRSASLSFRTVFHSHELSSLELPVEVRTPDLRVVGRTLTTKQLQVSPGEYFVSCRLPAGQEIQTHVKVGEGELRTVELAPGFSDESPSESLEVQHFLRKSQGRRRPRPREPVAKIEIVPGSPYMLRTELTRDAMTFARPTMLDRGLESYGPSVTFERMTTGPLGEVPQVTPASLAVRWFQGNALDRVTLIAAGDALDNPDVPLPLQIPFECAKDSSPLICQLLVAGRPASNVQIPNSPGQAPPAISLIVSENDPTTYRVGVRLHHVTADLLTRYLARGMIQEAAETMQSDSMTAEQLLAAKHRDPIAAAVGAYAILRVGDIDQLHNWTTNLMNWFEWLPDGAALRGEHAARLGNHKDALAAFLELRARGLPFFAEGLSYVVNRLRLYVEASRESSPFSDDDVEAAKALLARLRSFATFTDFRRPILTYTGLDPASPDEKPSILAAPPPKIGAAIRSFATSSLESAAMSTAEAGDVDTMFVFNGINGATGEYLEPPKSARQVAALALSDPSFPAGEVGQDPTSRHLRDLRIRERFSTLEMFGTRFGARPDSVQTAGWAVIFPRNIDARIVQALRPLLDLRKEQAGRFYKEFVDSRGYAASETKDDFLTRHGMGPGPADPEKVPYYILLVGDPETIPYQFQYQLDVQYAVGRIWFDTTDEFARYAESVVQAESGRVALPRRAVMFGPQNAGDRATQLSAQQLILPLAKRATERGVAAQWQIESIVGPDATRSRLGECLSGNKTPALLFTASHGMGFPINDPRQSAYQGALLCQDWPGPTAGRVDRGHYFTAEDVTDAARIAGLISFHFACYGAGTPRLDDFAHQNFHRPAAIARAAFIAPLPRRLLGHPSGGALAVVGHVERAWGCSITWNDAGRQIQAYEDAVDVLMSGLPVGYALESINQRYADLSSALGAELLQVRDGTKVPDDVAIAIQWTANNDARSHIIIGDPAVRLPLAAPGDTRTERPTIATIPQPDVALEPEIATAAGVQARSAETAPVVEPTTPATSAPRQPQSSELPSREQDPASVTVTLPLQITVNVAVGPQASAGAQRAADVVGGAAAPTIAEPFAIRIDPDYDNREGYDPSFLGTGARRVPLPRLSAAQLADAAVVNDSNGGDRHELKYHHYSVVLNSRRRLAFFTAVNIDGKLARRPAREADRWSYDPRVARQMQVGDELYATNPFDRGHLVRRLDPAWGRTASIARRANDDTFHFTNCAPQHERFNQGARLWAGLEDYLLNRAANEDQRMIVFTGPVFTAPDPQYRDVLIPKRYWKVAVVARPNGRLASLGFIVDQERLLRQVVSFAPTDVARTFQVPVRRIEELTGLNFGALASVDARSVDSFAVGEAAERELASFNDIVLPPVVPQQAETAAFAPPSVAPLPPETVEGTPLRYYLIAFDENGRERDDHPAGIISRIVDGAVADPATTDVIIFSHGWQGDVPAARRQYANSLRAMSANDADRARVREVRPGFRPVLVGIHWPSLAWGDERLELEAFSVGAAPSPDGTTTVAPTVAAEVEMYTLRMGDTPEARDRVREPLRTVLQNVAATPDNPPTLPPQLRDAYLQLDAALGLGAQGVGGDPSSDREPFDPDFVYQEHLATAAATDAVSFGLLPSKDALLAPLRALSYWKMKDRARRIGEGAVHDLLVRLQQAATGRNVHFHLVGHSFGCIVVSGAVAGPTGSTALPQPVDSLTLIQGAVSLWSYCGDIPYLRGTPGYYYRLVREQRVRGPIITTRSIHDTAVGTWYRLSSRVSRSVAFEAPGSFPKYGGIGSFGIQGEANAVDLKILNTSATYALSGGGAVANVEASEVISKRVGLSGAHSDICRPEVAHLVWAAIMA